jgi:hypothetical protein
MSVAGAGSGVGSAATLAVLRPMFHDLLFELRNWPPWILPVGGGTVATLLAFYLLHSMLSHRRPKEAEPEETEAQIKPRTGIKSAQDRRTNLRRAGNSVSVFISDADARKEPWQGWVIDRSAGGLCITTEQIIPAGTILSVRSSNASTGIPWVQVEVKNCRFVGKEYELGCQFVKTPPWSVLLMFG